MLDQILVLTPKFNVTTSQSQINAENAVKVKETHKIFIVVRLNPSLRPLYSFSYPEELQLQWRLTIREIRLYTIALCYDQEEEIRD